MSDYVENISNPAAFIEDDRFRHWSPGSQQYAPADVLINYMREGWTLDSLVAIETFSCTSCRHVDVYYFTLQRDTQTLPIPVVANPIVTRLIQDCGLTCWLRPFRGNEYYD